MSQEIASRDWHTRARVRIKKKVTTRSVNPFTEVQWLQGFELVMVQWGRAGREVERDSWWTSFDIDGAHIIDAANVEVIEVIDEIAPFEEPEPKPEPEEDYEEPEIYEDDSGGIHHKL